MASSAFVSDDQDTRGKTRRRVEGLVTYAEHLDPADRALIVSVFERGARAADLARAMGRDPRHVRRRLKRLIARMSSRPFRFVLQFRNKWPIEQRRVADAVVLRGLTQREAAQELELTLHQVRTHLHAIDVLMNTRLPAQN